MSKLFFAILASAACLPVSAGADDRIDSLYPQQAWQLPSGGAMHVSAFVFRDSNADGSYDLGDRPFAFAAVDLIAGGQILATGRSNVSGYVNFDASATHADAPIREPGTYTLAVMPPPKWRVTTELNAQTIDIFPLTGSPGDLIASAALAPVGLAPIEELRGTAPEGAQIIATGPGGQQVPVAGSAGRYAFAASRGDWQITTSAPDGASVTREVTVAGLPVALSTDGFAGRAPTPNLIVGFDDLIGSVGVALVPSGYRQLNWLNWVVTHNRTYGGEGYINGTISGEHVAYNGSGSPAAIESEQPFDFIGGNFSIAWPGAEGETLHIRAFRQDALLYEDAVQLSALGPVAFLANYQAVTRLEFMTEHGWQVVADDLAFRLAPADSR